MKKIIFTLIAFIFTTLCVSAETLIGIAMTNFSTEEPTDSFAVKIQEDFSLDNLEMYKAGTIFYGKVSKVVHGQIGKRKGSFEFKPTHYVTNDGVYEIYRKDLNVRVSFYKPFDKNSAKELAESGITTAAGMIFHVPLLSEGISFVKGAVQPDEDTNRVVSGIKKAYKDSPLSYVEKGEELYIHPGQEIKLKIGEDNE